MNFVKHVLQESEVATKRTISVSEPLPFQPTPPEFQLPATRQEKSILTAVQENQFENIPIKSKNQVQQQKFQKLQQPQNQHRPQHVQKQHQVFQQQQEPPIQPGEIKVLKDTISVELLKLSTFH
jgi:hypothetical protein